MDSISVLMVSVFILVFGAGGFFPFVAVNWLPNFLLHTILNKRLRLVPEFLILVIEHVMGDVATIGRRDALLKFSNFFSWGLDDP